MIFTKEDLSEKLISKYKTLVYDTENCIIFPNLKDKDGYGVQSSTIKGKNSTFRAHRISFVIFKGIIPADTLICHSCDNPSCINPKHLFLGTGGDNAGDCRDKGRANKNVVASIAVCHKIIREKSKLSFDDVKIIRQKFKEGISQAKLAKDF